MLQLLERQLLAPRGEQAEEPILAVPRQEARFVAVHGLERLLDLVGADGEHRAVVHVQPHEVLEANPVDVLAGLPELGVLDLGGHVLDLQLRREKAEGAHEVRDLRHGNHAVQVPGLRRLLVLRPDLRVVEVVLHVREELALLAAVQQLHERLDARAAGDAGARDRLRVDQPLVDGEVVPTTSEGVLPLVIHGDGRDLPRVRDQAHTLVRVAVQRQLYEAQHLLVSGVEHELILAVRALVHGHHLGDGVSICGRQRGLPA
mmetsp:Transcript_56700/g.159122  ORF Transcript_56700/g.159122 Transcript_56700/m.159122 type:complete len:260 (-) Transcript_56700:1896-2675(-)